MFTLDQIKAAHSKVQSGADFPNYIQDLIRLGVIAYDTYVSDGHTTYFGDHDFELTSLPKYEPLIVEETSNADQFIADLRSHQQGNTDYQTFCNDSAAAGVEKWSVDMEKMTCTYLDRSGNLMLVENIPVPN